MAEISLAWLLTKVTAPVVGATKLSHIEGAANAVDLSLSDDEITYCSSMLPLSERTFSWKKIFFRLR